MQKLLISYRRNDTSAEALKIYDALTEILTNECVFLDVKSIQPGTLWRSLLGKILEEISVLIVVIGPNWLVESDEWGRRKIDLSEDPVALEIGSCLSREIKIVPVLVRDASLPSKEALPSNVQAVVEFQSVSIRRDYFDHDIELLLGLFRSSQDDNNNKNSKSGIWQDCSQSSDFSEFDGSNDKVSIVYDNNFIRGTYRPKMYGSFNAMLGVDGYFYGTWTECNHRGSIKLKFNEVGDELAGVYTYENGKEAPFLFKRINM